MARRAPPPPTPDPLAERLAALRSRGEIKQFGAEIDKNIALRADLLALAARRGVEIEIEADGRRLIRALLDRAEAAQVRTNPIRIDEAFVCACCGAEVPKGGAMVRDHCPRCLRGLHVDRVPGDRAADCGGLLDPVGFELRGRDGVVLRYRCRRCGAAWQGRAHPDDRIPAALPGLIADPQTWMPEGRLVGEAGRSS